MGKEEIMDLTILPLAEQAGFRLGETVNVLMFNPIGGESMRILTDVYVKHEFGKNWLMVKWDSSGAFDCGFAGWVADDDFKQALRAIALATNPQ
jgi:hypothetical protein